MSRAAVYYENPRRLEYIQIHSQITRKADLFEHLPCTIEVYNLDTREFYSYELGYDCSGITALADGNYMFVGYDSDHAATSTLYLVDTKTGEQLELAQGEFESIESASPDGRFAVLVTDNNGRIDRATFEDAQFFGVDDMDDPQIAIFDTQTQQFVYEQELTEISAVLQAVVTTSGSIGWFDNHTLLILDYESIRLVNLANDNATQIDLPVIRFRGDLLDFSRLPIWTDNSSSGAISMYDLNTGEAIPLVKEHNVTLYDIEVEPEKSGSENVSVSVYPLVNGEPDTTRIANYQVYLP